MSSAGMADPELKKAFNDLQMKVVETQNRVNLADQQIGDLQQKCRRKEIAQKQITSYPDETVMYIGCGKMFMMNGKGEILNKLTKDVEKNGEKIKDLENQKELLKRNQKDAESNLRELINAKKQSSS